MNQVLPADFSRNAQTVGGLSECPDHRALAAATEYLVHLLPRMVKPFDGDLTTLLVFSAMWRMTANGPAKPSAAGVQDEFGTVSIMGVAQHLEMPYETARRHVLKLVDMGFCHRRSSRRFTIEPSVLTGPEFELIGQINRRLLGGLDRDLAPVRIS